MQRKGIIIAVVVVALLLLTAIGLRASPSGVGGALGGEVSFLGRSDLPRGLRNNNPGNLKMTSPQQGWRGALDRSKNTDGVFEQFSSYHLGLRAMLKLVVNKINDGHSSIRKLIEQWAPRTENNTEAYIIHVERKTGIPQNQPISIYDTDRLFLLAKAMELHENGMEVMNRKQFDKAYAVI